MPDAPLSQHPADILIRELIATRRDATGAEVQRILDRIGTAEFSQRLYRVPAYERGAVFQGRRLGRRLTALDYHLFKRIEEGQWTAETSVEDYVGDLRRIALIETNSLTIYPRQGGPIALAASSTSLAVPAARRGAAWLRHVAVIYSAEWGTMISGYQFSARAALTIPEGEQWLRLRHPID